jgi:hypothetical protein
MKGIQNPTLSAYLLEKANRFLLYPQRISGTSADRAVRKMYDQIRLIMVEWRKTFAPRPQADNNMLAILGSPPSLDEVYSRELLAAVPGIVERTLALSNLTLAGISESEFVYLREAANCYILGLPQAAIALSRAAVEDGVRKKLGTTFGRNTIAGHDLKTLIDDYCARSRVLSREGQNRAHKVRIAGNDVLHQQTTKPVDALDIIEATRQVILELTGGKGTPRTRS